MTTPSEESTYQIYDPTSWLAGTTFDPVLTVHDAGGEQLHLSRSGGQGFSLSREEIYQLWLISERGHVHNDE